MKIHTLSEETYEKISAGEVIDRPSSIIREIIDNAIDANSSYINISIIEGGKTLIQIKDDGYGMELDDLEICYKKHTTSKIKDFNDIYKVLSLGFRGEALNSIAVVSEMQIASKTKEGTIGHSITVKGGKLISTKEIAKNQGTTINIKNIFYNIPVRRQTLKSDIAEFRSIKEIFISKTIPFNNITFSLTHNDKLIYKSSKNRTHIERIELFFGKSISNDLIYIDEEFESFSISGYISKPNHFKKSKRFQFTYLNGRPIFSPMISVAIEKGYEGITPIGEYPFVFLFLSIPPNTIDPNVHPAKKEVKILNESNIYHYIYHIIKDNIQITPSLPKIQFPTNTYQSKYKASTPPNYTQNKNEEIKQDNFLNKEASRQPFLKKNTEISYNKNKNYHKERTYNDNSKKNIENNIKQDNSFYRILGSLFNTYVLIEDKEDFVMLDQHAAHERLEYEKIKSKITDKKITSQKLLNPFTIDVTPYEIDKIESKQNELSKLGFDIEIFGKANYQILSIPYFIDETKAKDSIENVIEKILTNNTVPSLIEYVEEMIKMKACKTAIKAGNIMSKEEINNLINQLLKYKNPFACPHGRPTALRLHKTEIERLFKRRK